MLDHDDRIRAFGNRRPGHNLNSFAGLQRSVSQITGPDLTNNPDTAWEVSCADGKSIPRRTRERRVRAVRSNLGGKDPADGGV